MSPMTPEQEARLLKLAKHYTGSDSIPALTKSVPFQSAFSKSGGNLELVIRNLDISKSEGVSLNCWFLGNHVDHDKQGNVIHKTTVLLPDGTSRYLSDDGERTGVKFLAPITLSNVTVIDRVSLGAKTFRISKETQIALSAHEDALPTQTLTSAFKASRSQRSRGNKALRLNKVSNQYFTGVVLNDDGHGIFVNEGKNDMPGRVSFNLQDEDGNIVQTNLSFENFQKKFGIDPTDDIDLVREVLQNREVRAFGGLDVTAKLSEEFQKENQNAIRTVLSGFIVKNKRGKIELKEPVQVANHIIQHVYETRDGSVAFLVDVNELGYTASFQVEPRFGVTAAGDEWSVGAGYGIQFVGVTEGEVAVASEYSDLAGTLQQYLDESPEPTIQ